MNVKKFKKTKDSEHTDIDGFIKFVETISNNNGHNPIDLVFYGGEPLLYQETILEFLEKSKYLSLKYSLHTNGILLDKMDSKILRNLESILLSIDGSESITNRNRGYNVYSTIKHNVEKMKKYYRGEIVARMTLTLDTSIKEQVLDLLPWVDSLYWQIENSPKFNARTANKFLKRYNDDIKFLVDYWINEAENGNFKNILPFQAVTESIILKNNYETLRCGCGSWLIVTDGKNCFACDELAETANEVYLGTIKENINSKLPIIKQKINEICADCRIRYICGGRCYNSLMYFPREKFKMYCNATHILVESIEKIMPSMNALIQNKIVNINQILHPALRLVDQIP